MTQQNVTTAPTDTDVPERLPERPVASKAQIMHDTGDEWFGYYMSNAYRAEVLQAFIELEAEREQPRRERIGQANAKLQELRS